ncbi:hypothetical protein [Marimonas arenosa]|uniref:Uncharacterized protein n=1 Tax=Marimonas arenosa TaxID=1795305 RepID=A0AAE3WF01_9RHOB|nr:hypothetical protein [Marimonas arenosa]MDQ2090497.1 hypothetical protein [Marimonas arenosa]
MTEQEKAEAALAIKEMIPWPVEVLFWAAFVLALLIIAASLALPPTKAYASFTTVLARSLAALTISIGGLKLALAGSLSALTLVHFDLDGSYFWPPFAAIAFGLSGAELIILVVQGLHVAKRVREIRQSPIPQEGTAQ